VERAGRPSARPRALGVRAPRVRDARRAGRAGAVPLSERDRGGLSGDRDHLVAACATIGCTIDPLRNRDEIAIDSHDLQADPAHQGLLILQTTLRNQSRHALAFPHLELQLDDNAGSAMVRRVFTPVEYAGGAADFAWAFRPTPSGT
jgi:hypothetical protein